MKISELPKEYKELAKKRIIEDKSLNNNYGDLFKLFKWVDTEEGNDFWEDCHRAESEEELPRLLTLPKSTQVGGSHYKDMNIQPIDFILGNDLGFVEGNIIKYVCRYKDKGGKKDIEKIIHYCDLLISQMEEE